MAKYCPFLNTFDAHSLSQKARIIMVFVCILNR